MTEPAEPLERFELRVPYGMAQCNTCMEMKPLAEYYVHTSGKSGVTQRAARCKDCDNGRERPVTITRLMRNRARNRAAALLIRAYPQQYERLVAEQLEAALEEAHQLGQAEGEAVRLKPGPKRAGQSIVDRIDVARCARCHTHHDAGHVCPVCGSEQEEEADVSTA